jgi:hypothetical protein
VVAGAFLAGGANLVVQVGVGGQLHDDGLFVGGQGLAAGCGGGVAFLHLCAMGYGGLSHLIGAARVVQGGQVGVQGGHPFRRVGQGGGLGLGLGQGLLAADQFAAHAVQLAFGGQAAQLDAPGVELGLDGLGLGGQGAGLAPARFHGGAQPGHSGGVAGQ